MQLSPDNTPRVLRVSASSTLSMTARAQDQSIEICAPVRRIVTIHSGSLRELLFSIPALRALRETFDGAHLTSVVREGLAPLLQSCRFVDELLTRPDGGLSSHAPLMAKLHARHCDVALSFSTSRNGTLLALSSGAHIRIGFDGAKMDALLTHRVARETEIENACTNSLIEDYLDLTRALGCAPRCHDYSDAIEPSASDGRLVSQWLEENRLEKEWIALSVQSEMRAKKTALETTARWARAAFLLSQRAPVVLCGARPNRALLHAAREYSQSGALQKVEPPKIFDAGGVFEIAATAALLKRARIFIGSGGASHLAAAMSTPVVALQSDDGESDQPRGVPYRAAKLSDAPEAIHRAALELIGL